MLVLFGDSFASEWEIESGYKSWFQLLAEELNTEYKTYGMHGTSFEYSTLKFYQYLNSEYNQDDIIVFVLTSPYRSPVISEDFVPNWAAMTYGKVFYDQQSTRDKRMLDERPDSDEHFNRYKTYYKDWFKLQNNELVLAQRFILLSALHSLPNKTISISGWDTEMPITDKFPNHLSPALWQASENEISDGSIVDFMEKHGKDFRKNHFHEKNHYVLKDEVHSHIVTGESNLTVDSFHKNLYSVK